MIELAIVIIATALILTLCYAAAYALFLENKPGKSRKLNNK